jgi:phosphohistidine swiveling domain-containing protein
MQYGTREWERDPSHFPLPLTPAFASCYVGWMERAFRVTCAEFGIIAETLQVRTRNGYLYIRVKPLGLNRPPPTWLAKLGVRLWWLHPALRPRVRRAVRRMRAGHDAAVLRRWYREWRPAILAEQHRIRLRDWSGMSDEELAGTIAMLARRIEAWVTVHFLLHAAISIPLTRLYDFLAEQPALREVSLGELLEGESPASSAPARALAEVAAWLRDQPDLLATAAERDAPAALALLRTQSPAFSHALARFLARFGQGIVGRYEFIVPTLAEQPWALVPSLLKLAPVRNGTASDAAGPASRRIDEAAARLGNPAREREFRSLVRAAQRAYAARDDNVQITFNDAFGLMRTALVQAGGRLRQRGVISTPDDVFFLRVPETQAALCGRLRIAPAEAAARRDRWRRAAQTPPPRALGRPTGRLDLSGLPPAARDVTRSLVRYMREILATPDVYPVGACVVRSAVSGAEGSGDAGYRSPDPALEIPGVAAVRGSYTGVARVVSGEEDFDRLGPGEVLVCSMTSPAWAPVLPLAGALVTDHGGILSHAAVIAREFGIPAVVATGRATSLIPDGATVEVDGGRGLVRVLR